MRRDDPVISACATRAAFAGVLLALPATAQPTPRDPGAPSWADARRVEQGLDDLSPLSASLRVNPIELRAPQGFEGLYRIGGPRGDLFARFDGGIAAVFPRSTYEAGPDGARATIPPDTRFVIGEPPEWLLDQMGLQNPAEATPRASGLTRIDARLTLRPGPPPSPPPVAPRPRPSGRGVRALLTDAVRVERAG